MQYMHHILYLTLQCIGAQLLSKLGISWQTISEKGCHMQYARPLFSFTSSIAHVPLLPPGVTATITIVHITHACISCAACYYVSLPQMSHSLHNEKKHFYCSKQWKFIPPTTLMCGLLHIKITYSLYPVTTYDVCIQCDIVRNNTSIGLCFH